MIRWRFIITRVAVLAAILYAVALGFGPVARRVTVAGLSTAVGAKVEIADAQVGLFPPRVRYEGVQIADPRADKSMRDAVTVDAIELVIDGRSLMHRRWVAESGKITGLRFGDQRIDSGHFEPDDEQIVDSPSDSSVITRWLAAAAGDLGEGIQTATGDLETVLRSREIRGRWQSDYDRAIAEAKVIERQIADLRDASRGIDNPLRDWEKLRDTMAKANATREQLAQVRDELSDLPQRFRNDLASMDEAKQIDLEKIDQYVPGDLSGADKLGIDLVKNAIYQQIATVRSYIDRGREIADYTVVAPDDAQRCRGRTYDMDRFSPPELLIRRCEIAGQLRRDGQRYTVSGIVENLTPTPELLDQPTRAALRLDGPEVVRMDYVRDRRGPKSIDVVTLHWPEMAGAQFNLGDQGGTEIQIDGGRRELWVRLRLEDDQVDGRLVSKQSDVDMRLNVDGAIGESFAAKSLAQSLQSIDRVEVNASITGTLDRLELGGLQTNLDRALKLAANDAVKGQIAASKLAMADRIAQVHQEESARLRDWIASHEGQADQMLARADSIIETTRQKILGEIGDRDYIGGLDAIIKKRF